jgi:hypothetical protein
MTTAWSLAALVAFLAACSGGQPQVQDLLLDAGDFPGLAVTETQVQTSETTQGEPAVQVMLSGPDFVLGQSLVLFETQGAARSILAEIKKGQIARKTSPIESGKFEDASGVLAEDHGGDETLSLFFVEGRALVRVTLSGVDRRALLPVYAEEARAKAGKQ